ncbi:MAG: hypothetical protein DMG12_22790 [Acidobacteria bacterium]|nr:MAG: hypothetical protein DMG12_22790 [Acidobacteriota bacterium]
MAKRSARLPSSLRNGRLCFLDRPGLGVDDRDRVSRIIDEQLFSGTVLLPQDQVQLVGPLLIQPTEPAVLVTIGIGLLVLLPNQLQGDMLVPVEIFMDGGPTRSRPRLASPRRHGGKQPLFQTRFVQAVWQGPLTQPCRFGPVQVIGDRTVVDRATAGNLPVGKPEPELES